MVAMKFNNLVVISATLLSVVTTQAQSDGKFCEGEEGAAGWECESLGTLSLDEISEEYSTLPGSPDPSNPVAYKQIAGEPAFDDNGTRTDTAAVFALYDSAAYFCMLAESDGEAALFDAPEGSFVSSREEFPTGSWLPESIKALIADGTKLKYIIYTHPHWDHMGAAGFVKDYFADDEPRVISSRRTRLALKKRDNRDPSTVFGNNRGAPVPEYWREEELNVGGLRFELTKAHAHTAGDYLIFLDKNTNENAALGISTSVLMIIDTVFPGWAPFYSFAISHDLGDYYDALHELTEYDFDTLLSGHLTRLGTKADVEVKIDFFDDVVDGARSGLASVNITNIAIGTGIGDVTNPNLGNTWLLMNEYFERVVDVCETYVLDTDARGRDWSTELAGAKVTLRSQCWAMQTWIRVA